MVPAQLMQPSRAWKVLTVVVIQVVRAVESVALTWVKSSSTVGETAVSCVLAASKRVAFMSEMERARAPRRVSSRAVASPIPEPAPVRA